jgi:dinuclear metal center YbgI/SA1388 family protein
MKVAEVLARIEALAPSATAESWDNVGLLAGDPAWKTSGAVVSVDLTDRSIERARARGFKLIVTHHPCIFPRGRGLSRVTSSGSSRLVFEALRQGVAVLACHTNFDRCSLEVVQAVSHGLGVRVRGRLQSNPAESLVKLVVFVPEKHASEVREAICAAGAGQIGGYDQCAFATAGEGTFRGGEGTRPFLGRAGVLEKARELRLETVVPRGLEGPVVEAMLRAHPYEEVAYDLYPLEQPPVATGVVRGLGYGFWGEFDRARPFSEVVRNVTRLFRTEGFLLTEPTPARVRKVAFVAGKGSSFLEAAASQGCDLFVTGEAGYHDALAGARRGMAVMELGHRESERFFLTTMEGWLSNIGLESVSLNLPTQKMRTGGQK